MAATIEMPETLADLPKWTEAVTEALNEFDTDDLVTKDDVQSAVEDCMSDQIGDAVRDCINEQSDLATQESVDEKVGEVEEKVNTLEERLDALAGVEKLEERVSRLEGAAGEKGLTPREREALDMVVKLADLLRALVPGLAGLTVAPMPAAPAPTIPGNGPTCAA